MRRDVRLWPLADMSLALHMSTFGGKADKLCGSLGATARLLAWLAARLY
jgi:hypothetical protein